MKRATIYSIAEELGISASTVSRAYSRPDLVKKSVRDRVVQTGERLGYEPNRAARGLATGTTGLIGLVVPDITNPFFPPLVRAIEGAAARMGSGVLLVDAGTDGRAESGLVARLKGQVDGLVIASPRASGVELRRAVGSAPAVVVNRAMRGIPSVVCDNGVALRAAAEHLAEQGHEKFALLRGPAAAWAARERAGVIRTVCREGGHELVELGPMEARFEDGRAAARSVIASGSTAVFAFDDLMACGVLAGLAEEGVRVPAEMSVVGCDDVLLARTLTPPMSTVSAPLEGLGRHAVEILNQVVTGGTAADVRLPGELVLRGTTGPVATRSRPR